MGHVTLIMTRTPLEEIRYGGMSGRWGRMVMVEGPEITSAEFSKSSTPPTAADDVAAPLLTTAAQAGARMIGAIAGAAVAGAVAVVTAGGVTRSGKTTIPFAGQALDLATDGAKITATTEFDTMERFRADSGQGFYMQVRPQPKKPYLLTYEAKNSAVSKLNAEGRCMRVHGHGYKQQGTHLDAGILVHEAPHIGWLIGCISPRLPGNRTQGENRQPSREAMEQIFKAVERTGGASGSLIVLDW